jgi:ABC-type Fe3+-citrate transport system substrate-binding protein
VDRVINERKKKSQNRYLFSGILNKVDQMESRLAKQDEKISNIREKIKGFGSMLYRKYF